MKYRYFKDNIMDINKKALRLLMQFEQEEQEENKGD